MLFTTETTAYFRVSSNVISATENPETRPAVQTPPNEAHSFIQDAFFSPPHSGHLRNQQGFSFH